MAFTYMSGQYVDTNLLVEGEDSFCSTSPPSNLPHAHSSAPTIPIPNALSFTPPLLLLSNSPSLLFLLFLHFISPLPIPANGFLLCYSTQSCPRSGAGLCLGPIALNGTWETEKGKLKSDGVETSEGAERVEGAGVGEGDGRVGSEVTRASAMIGST